MMSGRPEPPRVSFLLRGKRDAADPQRKIRTYQGRGDVSVQRVSASPRHSTRWPTGCSPISRVSHTPRIAGGRRGGRLPLGLSVALRLGRAGRRRCRRRRRLRLVGVRGAMLLAPLGFVQERRVILGEGDPERLRRLLALAQKITEPLEASLVHGRDPHVHLVDLAFLAVPPPPPLLRPPLRAASAADDHTASPASSVLAARPGGDQGRRRTP
jgi:hypothetical protein